MSISHENARLLIGAYALGGLDAADRERLRQHTVDCSRCRLELAQMRRLPRLLGQVSGTAGAEQADRRLVALLDEVRNERRTRRRRTALGYLAAVACAALVVGGLATQWQPGSPTAARTVSLSAQRSGRVHGRAVLVTKPWGTAVQLSLTGLPAAGPFELQVAESAGVYEDSATWGATSNGVVDVQGATSIAAGHVATIRVLGPSGVLVMRSL